MIGFVNGEIEEIGEDRVLVDCGFMGYNIFVPGNVIGCSRLGDEIKLYTYMSVREDAINLFGFLTKDELNVFKMLITVSGIGPKGALAILTVMTPNDLRFAVMSEDSKLISKAPGVGAKTAQKVILELKDKLKLEDTLLTGSADISHGSIDMVSGDSKLAGEAVEALTALGYSQTEALKAVRACDITDCHRVEDIIKLALKMM